MYPPYNPHHHHQHPQPEEHPPYPQQVWTAQSPDHQHQQVASPQSYPPHPEYPPGSYIHLQSPYAQQPQLYAYPPQQPIYAPQPLSPKTRDVHRANSVATHTTFRTNGVQYRPPRRHQSEDIISTIPEYAPTMRHPLPRRSAPASPQYLMVSPQVPPASPTSSNRSLHSSISPWGYLFHHPPGAPPEATPKLQRLLRSIGEYLISLAPTSEAVIIREKLDYYYATFSPHPELDHRSAYLRSASTRGLARLYTFLGCRFYWVPPEIPSRFPEGFSPALTIRGFVRWSTIQLLLCPDLECGVIDCVLRKTPLRDPETPTISWPRGFDRDAAGDVDGIAGEQWGRWWSVLLEPDEEETEVEALKKRIKELEGSDVMEVAKRERRRGDEVRAQERLEAEMDRLAREVELGDSSGCGKCGKVWCVGCDGEGKG